MPKSKITAEHRPKVPQNATEPVSEAAFLKLQGIFKVGPGDPVEDVKKARELIGIKGF